ncbi:MAG: TIM barrel protein [Clostridiales bacterium]|jgi:deoxyribonuclease-4|nr:TIM barrel protein [Clostridiales bacterium]
MVKFGPSGNADSFYALGYQSTLDTPKYLAERGLDAYEYSFGRGVNLTVDKATLFGGEFRKHNIELSVHAPYFINFANTDDEMVKKSVSYVLSSLKRLKAMGGRRCVFHPAAQGKLTRQEAFGLTKRNIEKLLYAVYDSGYGDMILCPETMGKVNQIGTVEEVLDICKMDRIFIPTFDFGHINARGRGILKVKDDFRAILDKVFEELDEERARSIHIHFSKIQYGGSGEVRHLTMEDQVYGPHFEPLAELLYEYRMTPIVLSESNGTQAEDAMVMKRIYLSVVEKYSANRGDGYAEV